MVGKESMIMGKLYAVEGATGSGKDTLLRSLVQKGYSVIRGSASQNAPENVPLTQGAKDILKGVEINYKKWLTLETDQRDFALNRYIQAVKPQLEEGVRLKNEGRIVFMNRSIISASAHIKMMPRLVGNGFKPFPTELQEMMEEIYAHFINEINGIILMKSPIRGVERAGMSGMQMTEAEYINDLVSQFKKETNKPVLELDANKLSVEEEISKIEDFIFNFPDH